MFIFHKCVKRSAVRFKMNKSNFNEKTLQSVFKDLYNIARHNSDDYVKDIVDQTKRVYIEETITKLVKAMEEYGKIFNIGCNQKRTPIMYTSYDAFLQQFILKCSLLCGGILGLFQLMGMPERMQSDYQGIRLQEFRGLMDVLGEISYKNFVTNAPRAKKDTTSTN